MKDTEIRQHAKAFAEYWKDKGYEKGESQSFWLSLLRDVLGVAEPEKFIQFEEQVMIDHTSFIDGHIPATHVLIEQKSRDKDLRKPIKQSDGSLLNPFQQAQRYSAGLPYSQRPRWIVTCNFSEFLVYDMENPKGEPEQILLKDLEKEYYRLKFITDTGDENIHKEMEVSIQAGNLVGVLYDEILKQYRNPEDPETLKSLNMLCVRLVFCLYAEDAGIFGEHSKFHNYIKSFSAKDMRKALIELFRILNQKPEDRDPYEDEMLLAFPYVNGGLFAGDDIEIPQMNDTIRDILLRQASEDFDWSDISPTIFGAVFESTLNPETRRSGGMHYTSIENIHKVIDPLFLDELREELAEIKDISVDRTRTARLKDFQDKISKLTFLDPACGSGNFLTETYISLRRLENEVLRGLTNQITMFTDFAPIKVSIGQFYGIEINDFAVTVAKTALWIAESQMMKETEDILHTDLDFLPLKSYANITEGNALRIDWETVVPKDKLNYIMGNPPFVGASMMTKEQKTDAVNIFGKGKRVNSIDYVGAWYHKAAAMMKNTAIRTAFVSTNSITQGEQVAPLWEKLLNEYNTHIDFAYRTFKWNNESYEKAAVHCVIIGFSSSSNTSKRIIYLNGISTQAVNNINPYLVDAPNILVSSRPQPLCDVPKMTKGNQPSDGGNLILTDDDRIKMVSKDPNISICIRRYVGAKDFINNNEVRFCLWLKGISPAVYSKNKDVVKRLDAVRIMRLASSAAPTRALAEKPYLFFSTPQTENNYLCIPEVSSERRKYIPIGFMDKNIIASNKLLIVPDANLFHFGVLTSNVHMAWTRVVTGRLEMRYQYSGATVYNNFPWCSPTDEQKAKIEQTAQAILDARALYPDCSLADLYDELTMPVELRKAHQANDKAVMQAYGFSLKMTESECVAELMKMYQELTKK